MAEFLEVDNAEVFDGEMEEETISRLKVNNLIFLSSKMYLCVSVFRKICKSLPFSF